MESESTDRLKLAAKFINNTASPIFLTGKAGTGKTTFLRNLIHETHKSYLVVAPTGIAALHAKGVTIHSQFLLPLGSFLPTYEPEGKFSSQSGCFTQHTLARKHPLNNVRKKVLRAIELLVIDEVSMLRADVLDAIDFRLRTVTGNREPFGGIQVLLIGDLHQLPPIVRDQEWHLLSQFYSSIHFFEAHALKKTGLVYLELDKIFRQKDEAFIQVLNHFRDNQVTSADVSLLNKQFKTAAEIKDLPPAITITTHNYKAEERNRVELQALSGKAYHYSADIDRDFPESLYPIPEQLTLKVGAQVMFIKNDSSGQSEYFNGKLAQVTSLDDEEIIVKMAESDVLYTLKKELWENKKYLVNDDTKELEEEVVGTFSHYPIKLAWAVTVHKSQGLTFERAIIDVESAFAPGQVYVALSRLKSLEGLILSSRIRQEVINSDPMVDRFIHEIGSDNDLEALLPIHEKQYLVKLTRQTFDLSGIIKELQDFIQAHDTGLDFEDAEMRSAMPNLLLQLLTETENTQKYQQQLLQLVLEENKDALTDRLSRGSTYYSDFLENRLKELLLHRAEVSRFTGTKKYQEGLQTLEHVLLKKYEDITKVSTVIQSIMHGHGYEKLKYIQAKKQSRYQQLLSEAKETVSQNPKFAKNKTGKVKKAGKPSLKRAKGETYDITFQLFEEGRSIEDIAKERGLATSTIESHLARGISSGRISIHGLMNMRSIEEIERALGEDNISATVIVEKLENRYSYAQVRWVMAHLRKDE